MISICLRSSTSGRPVARARIKPFTSELKEFYLGKSSIDPILQASGGRGRHIGWFRSPIRTYSRRSVDKTMRLTLRTASTVFGLLLLCFASTARAQNASPSSTPPPSPTATPAPTAVALADIVSASDSASERLNGIQSEVTSNKIVDNVTRELAA